MKNSATARRPSIREVASRAGVSVATVSRVLNGLPRVNPQTRARIQAVLDTMNYVPNGAARALSSRRSQTVGIIVPLLGVAVYSEAVQVIEEQLQDKHYYLLTAASGYDPQKEFEVARAMVERGVDALVLVGDTHVPALFKLLEQAAIPAVQTFAAKADSRLPSIGFDNYTPAYELTGHLVDLGHRQFAILHGKLRSNDRIALRFDGIMACLRDRGLDPDPTLIIEVGPTIAEGRQGLAGLLPTGAPFTALACTGDVTAIGALIEARQRGIEIPGQLSVTGFHDVDLATHTDPPLTTVHAPVPEMARRTAEFLLARLAGEHPAETVSLPTRIVLRKSVGPAPRADRRKKVANQP